MAEDIKIVWSTEYMQGDFSIVDSDIVTDETMETAVIISLFTDRRALDDDNIDGDNKRGWWGDQTAKIPGDQIGSKLWLLDRAKTTTENIKKAKIYIEESLKWMVTDGVAKKVEALVERAGSPGNDRLYFLVRIKKSDGSNITYNFDDLWTRQVGA